MSRRSPSPRSPSDARSSSSLIRSESSSRLLRNASGRAVLRSSSSRENSGEIGESNAPNSSNGHLQRSNASGRVLRSSSRESPGEIGESNASIPSSGHLQRNASGRVLRSSSRESPGEISESNASIPSSGHLQRNASGRVLRSSSSRESSGEVGEGNTPIPSNGHLQLKNYQPPNPCSSIRSDAATSPSTFFVMITGNIESARSDHLDDSLYCRYSFSYGPDWNVVHGVSMGLSQISRQGVLGCNYDEGGKDIIVWNFPIEISFQSTSPYGWPRLALAVYGFDFLGRDVLRGYAGLLLPVGPGRHTKYLRTHRPVSGSALVQFLNFLMGTNPEYYDSKMVTRGEGRAVTRVVSSGRMVKVNLTVTVKDFSAFGYASSHPSSRNC